MDMFDENMERHFLRKGMSLKTYYIIRRPDKFCGLFSLFNTHLGHINYAIKRGYVPVIDMMNYENCYLPMEKIGIENSWEYYFEQPSNTTLEEAYSGKRVILSAASGKILRPTGAVFVNKYKLNKWRRFVKQYIHVKRDVLDDIEKEYNTLVAPQDRVLGVLARGTDYVETKPHGHPIQPDSDMLIEKAKSVMDEYKCNKIFLGTEDKNIMRAFVKEFGEACVMNRKEYVDYRGGAVSTCRVDRENDYFLRGKEYLATIIMLGKSNCFIGGHTSGTVAVFLFSDGFEYDHVFNLGIYS